MIFSFGSLLYLQYSYLHILLDARNNEFEEAVKRTLYQVSKNLELDETNEYFQEEMKSLNQLGGLDIDAVEKIELNIPGLQLGESLKGESSKNRTNQSLLLAPSQGKTGSLVAKSQELQNAMQERMLYYKSRLNEVISRGLSNANMKPIEERINFSRLDAYLRSELLNNGLELPYRFGIVDGKGNVVYRSLYFDEKQTEGNAVYSQILFPKDPPGRLYSVQIYFPTKKEFLFKSIKFLAPSFGFTFVFLAVFVFTMYVVFRQKKLSEMKNDFINNMTHELKTPVSTISLASQMLKDSELSKSPQMFNHISGIIQDETKRLGFLVEKVLQMSLHESKKTKLKQKEMDANDLLANIAKTFALRVEKHGGKLEADLEALESAIFVDEVHFTNVLFNLMENAVKYRREDIPLLLKTRTYNKGNFLCISIQDNGIGIKKENLKRIFERFYRVSTGNKHDVKGFGLGLAYVKKIVDEHGAQIKVESELNVGTKFIIMLPYIKR